MNEEANSSEEKAEEEGTQAGGSTDGLQREEGIVIDSVGGLELDVDVHSGISVDGINDDILLAAAGSRLRREHDDSAIGETKLGILPRAGAARSGDADAKVEGIVSARHGPASNRVNDLHAVDIDVVRLHSSRRGEFMLILMMRHEAESGDYLGAIVDFAGLVEDI